MNTQTEATYPLQSQVSAPAVIPASRRLYWSVRRELWEYRSLYIAPIAVAALFLAGFLIRTLRQATMMRSSLVLDPFQHQFVEQSYNFAALLLMGTTFIIAVFYCLDALYGERRDRSILFWKSLPVSDLTIVLSKISIPLLVLPLLTFAITVVTQWLMLLLSSAILLASGLSVATLWARLPLFPMQLMLLYHLVVIHGLWYAPIYCWLMMVSAWARRAPFLWALLPPIVIAVVEKIAFNTSHFGAILMHRFGGGEESASFAPDTMSLASLSQLGLGKFLASPGLWTGLAVGALFLTAAVRLRRDREPI